MYIVYSDNVGNNIFLVKTDMNTLVNKSIRAESDVPIKDYPLIHALDSLNLVIHSTPLQPIIHPLAESHFVVHSASHQLVQHFSSSTSSTPTLGRGARNCSSDTVSPYVMFQGARLTPTVRVAPPPISETISRGLFCQSCPHPVNCTCGQGSSSRIVLGEIGLNNDIYKAKLSQRNLEEIGAFSFIYNQSHNFVEGHCSICLGEYVANDVMQMLSCNHLFHLKCLEMWFQTSYQCPLCRNTK